MKMLQFISHSISNLSTRQLNNSELSLNLIKYHLFYWVIVNSVTDPLINTGSNDSGRTVTNTFFLTTIKWTSHYHSVRFLFASHGCTKEHDTFQCLHTRLVVQDVSGFDYWVSIVHWCSCHNTRGVVAAIVTSLKTMQHNQHINEIQIYHVQLIKRWSMFDYMKYKGLTTNTSLTQACVNKDCSTKNPGMRWWQ